MTQTLTKRMATPNLLRAFSWVAIIEACTWVALLFGMYLKHVTQTTELAVRIFGSLHGAAFIAYVILTLFVARRQRWPIVWTTLLALAASVPPCTTAVFDLVARRRGLFVHAETSPTSPDLRLRVPAHCGTRHRGCHPLHPRAAHPSPLSTAHHMVDGS